MIVQMSVALMHYNRLMHTGAYTYTTTLVRCVIMQENAYQRAENEA